MSIYWELRNAVYADHRSVSTLGDDTLVTICRDLPSEHQPLIRSHLIAEVLLRLWLYVPEQRGLFQATIDACIPQELLHACDSLPRPRDCLKGFSPPETHFKAGSMEKSAWGHLCRRIQDFTGAEGMIPVICPDGTAIAVPFTLHDCNATDPTTWIRDAAGNPAAEWITQAAEVWAHIGMEYSVRLGCHLPRQTHASPSVTGSSLCLPLYLAVARRKGGDFPSWSFIATGAIRKGSIYPVDGMREKSGLARKLGVCLFIAPGNQQDESQLGLREGSTIEDAFRQIVERLERDGVRIPVPPRAKPQKSSFDSYLNEKRTGFVGREWLLEEIDLWRYHGDERALLVVGEPGIGKSSIVAQLVQHNSGGQVIAHHCCQADEVETLRPDRFVQSIAAMLASQLPEYDDCLAERDVMDALSGAKDAATAFSQGVIEPLGKIKAPKNGVHFILVDALDEAVLYEGNVNIVDVLLGRVERLPSWLRVVATTRHDPFVLRRLSAPRLIQLDANDSRNMGDIAAFIRRKIQRTPDLAGKLVESHMLLETVISILSERSHGNFLYAEQALKGVLHGHYSFNALMELPPGLEGRYLKFFERVFGGTREAGFELRYDAARPLLQVMVAAREPLTFDELAATSEIDAEEELPKWLRCLGQFLRQGLRDGKKTFTLYHKSFADWLRSVEHDFHISANKGRDRLAEWCGKNGTDFSSLLDYSRRHGTYHFVDAGNWTVVADRLTNLHYIECKVKAGEVYDLIVEYHYALKKMPSHSDKKDARRMTEVFLGFVAAEADGMNRFAKQAGFVVQQALNYEAAGPVRRAAEEMLPKIVQPILARRWPASDECLDTAHPIPFAIQNEGILQCVVDRFWRQTAILGYQNIFVWDLNSGALTGPPIKCSEEIVAIHLTEEGKLLTFSKTGEIALWDLEEGKVVFTAHCKLQKQFNGIAVTPDGGRVVFINASFHGQFTLEWLDIGNKPSLNKNKGGPILFELSEFLHFPDPDCGPVDHVPISNCGKFISINNHLFDLENQRVCDSAVNSRCTAPINDCSVLAVTPRLESINPDINGILISPDGTKVLVCKNSSLELVSKAQFKPAVSPRERVREISLTPDGASAMALKRDANGKDVVQIWDVKTASFKQTLTVDAIRSSSSYAPFLNPSLTLPGKSRSLLKKRGTKCHPPELGDDHITFPGEEGILSEDGNYLIIWNSYDDSCTLTLEHYPSRQSILTLCTQGRIEDVAIDARLTIVVILFQSGNMAFYEPKNLVCNSLTTIAD